MHPPISSQHTGASSGEKQIVATEHADDTAMATQPTTAGRQAVSNKPNSYNKIHASSHDQSIATEDGYDAAIATEQHAASHHTVANSLGSLNQGSAGSHDEQNAATEHVNFGQLDAATEHIILLTIDEASEVRRTFRGQPGKLHAEARLHLNQIST